ncbi:MAG: hypothetical protein KA807_11780 [Prolixibacteraceae bacterium]|nr:hypothetical protein [Prolixibacteraceae bacterium]
MKKLILLFAVLVLAFTASAQEVQFAKGDKVFNIGVGLDSYRIPVSVSGEFGIVDGILEKGSIGVGAYAGAGFTWWSYYSNHLYFFGGARGAFHYTFIDKLDTYAGISLGISSYYSSWLSGGGFLGARYYMSPKMAIFGEVGYGLGLATVGVAFKL